MPSINDPGGSTAADAGATVITGASGGMGHACALRFAGLGRRLVLCDLREEAVAEVAAAASSRGAEVTRLGGDIADPAFPAAVAEQLGGEPIGVLIHTAGLSPTMADGARILEVTHTDPAEVVFEVVIDDPAQGWTVYRSERLASLYPE